MRAGATLYEMCTGQALWRNDLYDAIPSNATNDMIDLCECARGRSGSLHKVHVECLNDDLD